jgi:hypothetical protein
MADAFRLDRFRQPNMALGGTLAVFKPEPRASGIGISTC